MPACAAAEIERRDLFGTPLNDPLARVRLGGAGFKLEPGNASCDRCDLERKRPPFLKWKGVRVVLGMDDQVVGNKYADLVDFAGDLKPAFLLKFDHGDLVKPKNWASSTIRDEIVGALQ